ncbi:MAG: uracil-DNA glycosylase family protein [Woeseiaceae bacterium]|nr:uracil-DNA glycosylase family protein [Woeseiaceae bacterium]
MTYSEHQRRAYLQAIGIDVWLPRDTDKLESSATDIALVNNLGWDHLKLCVFECSSSEKVTWMIIGESFIDRSNLMLDEMLRAVGQERKSESEETLESRDYLDCQIAIVKPSIILAVGKSAAQKLLDCDDTFERMRGQPRAINEIPLVVTYHPLRLLHSPLLKRESWSDLCLAQSIISEAAG